ncbi:MAG: tRNA (adenosine(37)-N6)-dimethylallyltransferase MiaA [Lachnospiraceae bacterium]|nr:tRNA (adenosine(37)-N6)-dimethylallyltransferase MiaA [Lachnospiraceae bacterium]
MMKPKLIIVAGPTAVGKTEYAIELAKKIDGEIVSLDSVQVYKGLDIGSAKPDKEQRKKVPHYMIDEVEPTVNLNVKDYKDMAVKYIDMIIGKGKIPILVGGSGFYINAVLYDTDFLYEDEGEALKIRKELEKDFKEKGADYLYDMLGQIDKESLSIIPKENVRRVIRAIEFYRLHGIPISEHNEKEKKRESRFDYTFYVLDVDREELYNRINERVDKMICEGLLVEVKRLINQGLSKDLNSMNSIGYKELYDFCEERKAVDDIDKLSAEDKEELKALIELVKQHSRNYAKRQLTWFRAQKNIIWVQK